MHLLSAVILICCNILFINAQELPTDLSKSFERSQQRYQSDIDESIEDLDAAFTKLLAKHVKAYEKLERSLKKKGEIDGLKAVSARLRQLKKTTGVNVFGAEVEEKQSVDMDALAPAAQALERAYVQATGEELMAAHKDMSAAIESFKEAVIEERKRLVKGDRLDAAEQMEQFAQELSVAVLADRLQRCCDKTLTLSPLMVGAVPLGAAPTVGIELFRFLTAPAKPLAINAHGALVAPEIELRGTVGFDEQGFMQIQQGSFVAAIDAAAMVAAVERANALSVEALIQTDDLNQQGPARIISFSLDGSQRNLTIGQSGNALVLRLRTANSGLNGTKPEIKLGIIENNQAIHVLFSYEPGVLRWWWNGVEAQSKELTGDLQNWDVSHGLVFGDEYRDSRPWRGRLGHIRILAGAVDEGYALRAFANSQQVFKK